MAPHGTVSPARRRRRAAWLLGPVAALALSACEGPADPGARGLDGPVAPTTTAGAGSVHVHDDSHSHGPGHEASGLAGSAELVALLPGSADLPAGYAHGAHHATATGDQHAPSVPGACLPIARAVGVHASVMPEQPHARTTFSKSHFGPEVTVTLVEHGSPADARAEVAAFANAARTCATYVQGTPGQGAFRYAVGSGPMTDDVPSGEALRLTALGADFSGIHWDVWEQAVGGRVVVVALRSARGGSSTDLPPTIRAVLRRVGG